MSDLSIAEINKAVDLLNKNDCPPPHYMWIYPSKVMISTDNQWLVWLFWNEAQFCDEITYIFY